MRDVELFQAALGLSEPWRVVGSSFDASQRRLELRIDFERGARFACPECDAAGCVCQYRCANRSSRYSTPAPTRRTTFPPTGSVRSPSEKAVMPGIRTCGGLRRLRHHGRDGFDGSGSGGVPDRERHPGHDRRRHERRVRGQAQRGRQRSALLDVSRRGRPLSFDRGSTNTAAHPRTTVIGHAGPGARARRASAVTSSHESASANATYVASYAVRLSRNCQIRGR